MIDVSDPSAPTLVRVLETSSRELLAAQVAEDRALLATRHRDTEAQDGQVLGRDMLVDVWDIRTCTDPQLLGTVRMPTQSKIFGDPPAELGGPAHNLKFNPSATKLYGSLPLHEVDLANLEDPSTLDGAQPPLRDHRPAPPAPTRRCRACATPLAGVDHPFGTASNKPPTEHEPTFNPDGSRLYIGGQLPEPDSNAMWVLDMTGPDPVVLSVTDERARSLRRLHDDRRPGVPAALQRDRPPRPRASPSRSGRTTWASVTGRSCSTSPTRPHR